MCLSDTPANIAQGQIGMEVGSVLGPSDLRQALRPPLQDSWAITTPAAWRIAADRSHNMNQAKSTAPRHLARPR